MSEATLTQKLKIILIENDTDELYFMKESFEEVGLFEIIATAENGDQLMKQLSLYEHNLPDVILTDMNMPGKSGTDILYELASKALTSAIPVVISSTVGLPPSSADKNELKAALYMIKPDIFTDYKPFAREVYEKICVWMSKRKNV